MALIDCQFYSETLQLSTSMTAILPLKVDGSRPKVLYLLHGLSDDHTIWTRRTSVERYVALLGVAVVMPAAGRSFYTDMAFGGAYETFVAEELPRMAQAFFHLSPAREDNYIAGLSMGGYGAFKLALNYPERYCAAASLSGVLDLANRMTPGTDEEFRQDFINVFGPRPDIRGTKHDLQFAARRLKAENKEIPRLYQCCGDADRLYEHNTAFRDFARSEGLPLTWQEDAGYGHTWDYWDFRIQTVLTWMFGGVAGG
jgi:S-formylglutathione hydrolase FrmB